MRGGHSQRYPASKPQFDAILKRCEGAYAHNTLRGYRTDLIVFARWCELNGQSALPASAHTVAAFVDAQIEHVVPNTLKRRLAAIRFAHRYGDEPDPTQTNDALLAMRRAARRKPRRPKQAKGLTVGLLLKMIEHCPDTPAGLRDAAMISLGYDTLCRSCELAAIRVEDIQPHPGGDWSLLIAWSKGDQSGDGRTAWLSPRTVDLLGRWLDLAEIESGPIFRALNLRRVSDQRLDPTSIRRAIKRAAHSAGIDPELAAGLSGHSMRIGAAQDMMVAGFDTLAIMQAGGWKTPHVLLRYVENACTRDVHAKRWAALAG